MTLGSSGVLTGTGADIRLSSRSRLPSRAFSTDGSPSVRLDLEEVAALCREVTRISFQKPTRLKTKNDTLNVDPDLLGDLVNG